MSYLVAPLQAAAGFATGTLLTTGVMFVGAKSARKLSNSNFSMVAGAIAGMTLLMGVVENSRAMSPFHKGMQTAVKVVTIFFSTMIGAFCGALLSSYRSVSSDLETMAAIGNILSIIVSIFLSIMSLPIHPMIAPVVGSTISCVLVYTVGTTLNNI